VGRRPVGSAGRGRAAWCGAAVAAWHAERRVRVHGRTGKPGATRGRVGAAGRERGAACAGGERGRAEQEAAGAGRQAARPGAGRGAGLAGVGANGGGRERRERGRREGEKRKKKKRKKRKGGKRNGKKEKRNKEKENGREREKIKEGGGAVRASGDCGRGRWGTRTEGRGKKEGRDSRRLVTTRRVGWEGDETWIEIGCRVRSPGIGRSEQEGFREVRIRV